ncbi:MAG TPA: protein kinase [Kofleriaceae bacterium]|jgi:tetratricopeptide (TPR) repeat protein
MECLDDNAVLAYVERLLPDGERAVVEAHLADCEVCLTITCAAARSEPAGAGPAAYEHGAQVGRYTLVEMIGRGGMGAVYVAHDPQLDRRVALKVVRSERFAHPAVRARMSREARAMAKVAHPHVVTVFDTGELPDGVFIAMELVDGDTLGRWLAAAPRTWRDIVRIFVAIGRGLSAAHQAGVVHRDFKPDNVLVDRAGRPAVTDFGLAAAPTAPAVVPAALAAVSDEGVALTRTGVLMGTPRYMSPEQFRGGAVDASSDQFSFAVALWEALYAQAPFAGESLGELAATVTAGALRERPAGTQVPPRVHRALVRALSVDPAARFSDLPSLLAELSTAATPARWWLAGVLGAAAVALALAAVALMIYSRGESTAALVGGVDPWTRAIQAHLQAVRDQPTPHGAPLRIGVMIPAFTNTTGDKRLDDTLDSVVGDVLYRSTQIDPAVGAGYLMLAQKLGADPAAPDDVAAKLRAHEPRRTVAVHGSVARDAGGITVSLVAPDAGLTASEHVATAEEAPAAAVKLGAKLSAALGDPRTDAELARVLSPSLDALHDYVLATNQVLAGQLDPAEVALLGAIAADPDFAEARGALGLLYLNEGNFGRGVPDMQAALAHAGYMPERTRLVLVGDSADMQGHHADAIMAYEQVLARWPGDARTEVDIVAAAITGENWSAALDLARRAAEHHGDEPVARANLVLALLGNDRFAEAQHEAMQMIAEVPHPFPWGYVSGALAAELAGDPAGAQHILDLLAPIEPELAMGTRADIAIYENRLDDAEKLLKPFMTGRKLDDIRDEYWFFAQARARRGDKAGAITAARFALDRDSARSAYQAASLLVELGAPAGLAERAAKWGRDPRPEWRYVSHLLLGDLQRALGHPREALSHYTDAAGLLPESWLAHDRMGRAHLALGDKVSATEDFAAVHRGPISVYTSPSISMVPR